jgi:two-component system response regulator DesR
VAVLDISNMGPFVALATAALRDAHPGIQIVLTSRCGGRSSLPAQARAAGFLPPDTSGADAVEIVRAAVLGPAPATAPRPRPAEVRTGDVPPRELTVRERQVLELMATGATNREIAAELHLGPDTIKKHAAAVFRKLGVRNRTEAVQQAVTLFS